MTRLDAHRALLELASEQRQLGRARLDDVLKVLCRDCEKRVGDVHAVGPDLLWRGYQRNVSARELRDGQVSFGCMWVDQGPRVLGECRCMRATGIVEPGWPTEVNKLHAVPTALLLAQIAKRRRVLRV